MKKIPWKKIFFICLGATLLVVARCVTTVARTSYYGASNGMAKVMADPWSYVGIAAALVGLIALANWWIYSD